MALREFLLPWEAQPQEVRGPSEWARSLGVVALSVPHHGVEVVSGNTFTRVATPTITAGRDGVGVTTNGTTSGLYCRLPKQTVNEFTLFAIQQASSPGTDTRSLALGDSASDQTLMMLNTGSVTASRLRLFARNAAGSSLVVDGTSISPYDGSRHVIAMTYGAAGGLGYSDGERETQTFAGTLTGFTFDQFAIGLLRRTGNGSFWSGSTFLAAAFTRQLSEVEIRQLGDRPWDLFEPQRIWVPVSAGGGGSWSVDLTESASGTDTSTASFAINASVSITEYASGTDTPAAASVMARAITENASGADTITAANTMARSITENASATDDQSETYSATGDASIVESASATDTLTAAATVVASLIESASAADILSAATIAVRAITESASATDTQSQTYSAAGTVSIVESANATDTITAAATLLQAITESASATDTATAATTMVRVITENGNATDLIVGFVPAILNASITELAAAYDTVAVFLPGVLGGSGNWVILVPRDDNAVLVALDEHLMAVAVQ